MKIEIGENLAMSATISIIAIGLCCLIGYLCKKVEETEQEKVKQGLVEKQKEGSAGIYWTKP